MSNIFKELTRGIKFDKKKTKDVKDKLSGKKRRHDEATTKQIAEDKKAQDTGK